MILLNKTNPFLPFSFKGDKEIIKSLGTIGLNDRMDLVSDDRFITRNEISEADYIKKILDQNSSKRFLIVGDAASGKSTFMLRIAHLLEKNEGIKIFIVDNIFSPKAPEIKQIKKYLNQHPNDRAAIFLDELWHKVDVFAELYKMSKNNPNVVFVATALNDNLSNGSDAKKIFPVKNRIALYAYKKLYVPMINSALQSAGFSELPEKIAKLLDETIQKTSTYHKFTIRRIFNKLYKHLSQVPNRIDDKEIIETIPDSTWMNIINNITNPN